jgi:hypothetical protein
MGRMASLVLVRGESKNGLSEEQSGNLTQLANELAMHVVAAKPLFLGMPMPFTVSSYLPVYERNVCVYMWFSFLQTHQASTMWM